MKLAIYGFYLIFYEMNDIRAVPVKPWLNHGTSDELHDKLMAARELNNL